MASVNPLSRELVFKIVYYGPGLGGKTTTLEYLHNTAKPEHRGKLVSLATPVDRTLYFDFLPVRLPPVRGMNVRLQLFTVPGQVYFNATRKLVLTGADGIVFVSDSQSVRADANLESLENLRDNLAEQGRDLRQIPLVFQHNKRDLPDLLPLDELDEMLNPFQAVSLPASAKTGLGIYEGLEEISALVLRNFEDRLPDAIGGRFGAMFDAVEGGLVTALRDASPPPSAPFDAMVSRLAPAGKPWSSMPPDTTLGDPSSSERANELPDITRGEHENGALRFAPTKEHLDVLGLDSAAPGGGGPVRAPDLRSVSAVVPGASALKADRPLAAMAEEIASSPLSFAALWPAAERPIVEEVEAALGAERYARAIERCDALVTRVLATAADLVGAGPAARDPAMAPIMLGLDGRRYLGFRSAVMRARSGGELTARDALAAFAFAIDARLAESSL